MAITPQRSVADTLTPLRFIEKYAVSMRPQMSEVTITLKVTANATHGTPKVSARPEKSVALGNALLIRVSSASAGMKGLELRCSCGISLIMGLTI